MLGNESVIRSSLKAVVVNNDITQRNVIADLLRKANIEPIQFTNVEDALTFLNHDLIPALIVTGLNLPGIDGWRFCRLLRSSDFQKFNQTPILVVSSTFPGEEPNRITFELGANAFLPMPVGEQNFLKLIQSLLKGETPQVYPKVLVVDNNQQILDSLINVFRAHGYQTDSASTRKEAQEWIEQKIYDVVILDHHLPDGKGDNLLAEVQKMNPNCICIMMTKDISSDLAVQWLKTGVAAYIRKPFEPEYVLTECERARREQSLLRIQNLLETNVQQLKKSEERFLSLLESSEDLIFILDREGVFLTAAGNRLKDFGLRPEDVIHKSLFDLFPAPEAAHYQKKHMEVFASNKSITYEQTFEHAGITKTDLTTVYPIRNESGGVEAVGVICRDITEEKRVKSILHENQILYQDLIETQTDLVSRWLPDTTLTFVNDAYCKYFDRTREQLIGTRFLSFLPLETQAIVQNAAAELVSGDKKYKQETEKNYDSQGNPRWVTWNYHSISDVNGKIVELQSVGRDITKQKQVEETLLSQLAYNRKILHTTCDGFWLLDANGKLIEVNDAYCSMSGYSREELLGLGINDLDAIEDPAETEARIQRVIRNGYEIFQTRHRRKDGIVIDVEISASYLSTDGGQFICFCREITDRKQMEEKLSNEATRRQILMEQSRDGIVILDQNGKVYESNIRFADMLGYPIELMGQLNVFDWEALYLPEQVLEMLQRVDEKGDHFETRHHRKDGSIIDVEISTNAAWFDGQKLVFCICRDITERKRIEQELLLKSLVLNQIQDHVTITDLQGNITYVNEAETKTMGFSREELIGKSISIFGENTEKGASQNEIVENTLRNGTLRCEVVNYSRDGREHFMDCRTQVVYDDNGNPIALCGISTDITEQKRLQSAINSRLVALTRPLDQPEGIQFSDLFNLDEIQLLQDQFSTATGVASIITQPDGTPITRPSNFCHLCNDIIRKTEKGEENCHKSDSALGRYCPDGPIVQPCTSGGLWDAGAAISVGGRHIANWLIGQVRNEIQSEEKIREYAQLIGANENEVVAAFQQVPAMSLEKFEQVAKALFTMSKTLSAIAYQNVQQARFIAERKQAEQELTRSERKFRNFFDLPLVGMAITSPEKRWIEANAKLCELLGYTPEELYQLTWADLTPKDDLDLEETAYQRILAGEKDLGLYEKRYIRKDGSILNVIISANCIRHPDGSADKILAIIQDITERKQIEEELRKSEERYQLIDDASQDFIYSYDRQGCFTHANSSLCKLLGLTSEQIIGKTHAELGFPQVQCEEWERLHQQVYATNRTVVAETATPVQGGDMQYFEVVLNPIHDEFGTIIGIAGTTRDINARKQAEIKIHEQLEELKRWHNITLGREERILDLKREINQLLAEAGKPPRFASIKENAHA